MNDRRQYGSSASKSYYKKKDDASFGERRPRSGDSAEKRFGTRDDKSHGERKYHPNGGKFRPADSKYQGRKKFPPKNLKPRNTENAPRIVSDMQVTDGKHRGKYLKCGASPKVRPTARRIREVMFRILSRRTKAGRFLDLCAGSGTVGIEAISRGALIGTFVERSAKMCSLIRKNMEALEIKNGHGELFEMELVPFLKSMAKRKREWDVVYFDPPYDADYDEILKFFARGVAVKRHGVLVIEHHSEMFFPENFGVMRRWRVVDQGETSLSFYDRK